MPNLLYLAPGDMVGLNGTGGGPAAATYNVNWITDGLPGRPVRATSGSATWSATGGPDKLINFIALINSNVDEGETVGTSLSDTPPVLYAGRVPLNPFVYGGATGLTDNTFEVSVAGNSVTVVAGLIVGGTARELERPIEQGGQRKWLKFNRQPDPQMGNVAVYRTDKYARTFAGTTTMTQDGLDALQAWHDSTNDGELPSIIVPDPDQNDAWCVKFGEFGWEKHGPEWFTVSLSFIEYPRVRW